MQHFPTAAITDEFSTDNLDAALAAMRGVGMTGAELRVLSGRNVMELSDDEIDRVRAAVEASGMRVLSIASPLLKCVLPDAPAIDGRFQQDVPAESRAGNRRCGDAGHRMDHVMG